MWLSLLGVALLGIIALSLSRENAITDPTGQSFEIASAAPHSSFAKCERAFELAASSDSSHPHADEIDAIDFSLINDRRHWFDAVWVP